MLQTVSTYSGKQLIFERNSVNAEIGFTTSNTTSNYASLQFNIAARQLNDYEENFTGDKKQVTLAQRLFEDSRGHSALLIILAEHISKYSKPEFSAAVGDELTHLNAALTSKKAHYRNWPYADMALWVLILVVLFVERLYASRRQGIK